ncbi:uncharacterized protein LOC121514535 [Cheilinus undulatus]|uniref:uncharacterized protein LOC121514535 n=1 Tax=Cheilinus undulatus TaxID=241271 RepID=UPI001BD41BC4|nr:uncharacterized protein LOC121514535 [Cheilinus undulatus]
MEQGFITGLYRSLGLTIGAEFSYEDVSLLFQKVFHVPCNTAEAHVAMRKLAGDDNSWCCVGENVLDVLLEMEREREKKDKLYWDLQLLNAGNLNSLYETGEPFIIDPLRKNSFHHSTEQNILKKAHNQSESESGTICGYSPQRGSLMGNKELCGSVRAMVRLKKAARQCWARLASEGVQSILPSYTPRESLPVRCQAWGCVSLSEIFLLIEVKYDVVTHLLYTEMLQEHYTLSVWESLPVWQQQKEEEELECLAEEALQSKDMLSLAELPGAFRIYRANPSTPLKSVSESREESWSAVSFLSELHTCRQQEKDTLSVLCKRLDSYDLRLICLYIRLATLRGQRENSSYHALMAAQQSWEGWPQVRSPYRAEQAALWLHGGGEEPKSDLVAASPQQAVLQLLVLTQEQERKYLIKMLHGVSLEDLQESESPEQSSLRTSYMKRLKQIYKDLQTQNETPTTSKQANAQPQYQSELKMNNRSSNFEMWSKHQLEYCSLLLLVQVMEFQEVQVSTVLPALMDESQQRVRALQDEYNSQLQAQRFSLQLLISEAPLNTGFRLMSDLNIENSNNQQITAQSCSGSVDVQNSDGSAGSARADQVRGSNRDVDVIQAADDKRDVCTGCGAVMEDLPYLEILCVSDTTSTPHQSLTAEGRAQEKDEGPEKKSTECVEKQGSLITLAWSKPPDDDTECEAEGTDGQSQDPDSCLKTQVQPTDINNIIEHTSQSQETSGERDKKAHVSVDTPMIEQLSGDLSSSLTNKAANVERAEVEVEICPVEIESELWDLRNPEAAFNSQVDCSPAVKEEMKDSSLMENERAREQVSAVERERTMRNLVDMQRKVEQRQQRDRERQLLRVQERLSIVQNRKAEEDLLGLKHTDRLKHLTQDLPQDNKNQQKTVVKERLEQLRRERSYVMQSKRERNTTGFKELLGPVALRSRETDDGAD